MTKLDLVIAGLLESLPKSVGLTLASLSLQTINAILAIMVSSASFVYMVICIHQKLTKKNVEDTPTD